jgi:hypothetical protein
MHRHLTDEEVALTLGLADRGLCCEDVPSQCDRCRLARFAYSLALEVEDTRRRLRAMGIRFGAVLQLDSVDGLANAPTRILPVSEGGTRIDPAEAHADTVVRR